MTAEVPTNLVRALTERSRRDPDGVAYRWEHLGIWHEATWAEVRARVERSAAALLQLGLEAGEKVVFLVPPTPDWFCLDLATQAVGAVPLALYESFPDERLVDLLEEHGPRFLLVRDAETFERIRRQGDLSTIDHVIVTNGREDASHESDGVTVRALDDLTSAIEPGQRDRNEVDLVEGPRREAPVLVVTAGTTGPPRTAAWTPVELLEAAHRWVEGAFIQAGQAAPSSRDRIVAELPVAHIAGRLQLGVLPITHGIVVHYPERVGGSLSATRAVVPTLSAAPARVWQLIAEAVDQAVATSGRVRRWLVRRARGSQRASVTRRRASASLRDPVDLLYRWCVVRPAMRRTGLSGLRLAQVVEGPLSRSLVEVWRSWGVELAEGYATAELGLVAVGFDASDGEGEGEWLDLLPGLEAVVSPMGHLHIRVPDRTVVASADDDDGEGLQDGWTATGDVGVVDGNRVRILGPTSDALRLPSGEFVPAFDVERVIADSRYVRAANVYISSERVSAIIEPAIGRLRDDLGSGAVVATNRGEIMADPAVTQRLRSELAAANERLVHRGLLMVRRFTVLTRQLDPLAGDPVTPTRKVRRAEAATLESEGLSIEFDDSDSRPTRAGPGSNLTRLAADEGARDREVRT